MTPNFPFYLTKLIGREDDIAELKRLLKTERLLTLTGTGGAGKTRLAVEVGSQSENQFPDGIYWIDLVPISDESLIPDTLAASLGVRAQGDQPIEDELVKFLAAKEALILFDNCEHVINTCATLIDTLLRACPKIKVMATSRESLGVDGEHNWSVSGLSAPSVERKPASPSDLLVKIQTFEAVQMFIDRVVAVQPDFKLSEENAFPVAKICRCLDGIPLAIELVSPRVNALALDQILSYLENQISLLSANQQVPIDPRHQSLEAVVNWSYNLLTRQEQFLLRQLSVFSGGFSLEAVKFVYKNKDQDKDEVLALLSSLINKSLVVAETSGRKKARYHLLESIRLFSQKRLEEAGEAAHIRIRHLDYFMSQAEDTNQKIQSSLERMGLQWMEENHNNLRKALEWAFHSERIEDGLKLATACSHFWSVKGYNREGLSWFEQLLKLKDKNVSPFIQMNAYLRASSLAMFLGEESLVNSYASKIIKLGEEACEDDDPDTILAIGGLVFNAHSMGEYKTAFALQDQAIGVLQATDDHYSLGWGLILQAGTAIAIGKNEVAKKLLEEGKLLAKQNGDNFRIALALNYEGDLARSENNYSVAKSMYERSIALYRDLDSTRNLASVANNLGFVALQFEDNASAFNLFSEALSIFQSESNLAGIAESLLGFGALAIVNVSHAIGLRLLEAGMELGGKRLSNWAVTNQEYQHYRKLAKANLTENKFHTELEVGRGLSVSEAMAVIENIITEIEDSPISASLAELTPREVEVVELILIGMTNNEIASELVISKRTVEKHVSNILGKLQFSNRSQIVRWAIEQGWGNPGA